ncbi:hypothetical protein GWI33_017068 [Rhynchophorus ferrugineus]|uniref:Uncharacterized protein n=1 Tax=Rhynchophorus ferrugineus TaxID=354439 RepID=A0A834I9W7_RHYFE|nr:hypothetical protein GWI33_017068 [Rhynchophorus ferrugineus]
MSFYITARYRIASRRTNYGGKRPRRRFRRKFRSAAAASPNGHLNYVIMTIDVSPITRSISESREFLVREMVIRWSLFGVNGFLSRTRPALMGGVFGIRRQAEAARTKLPIRCGQFSGSYLSPGNRDGDLTSNSRRLSVKKVD